MNYDDLKPLYDVYYRRSIERINDAIIEKKRKNKIIIWTLLGGCLVCQVGICMITRDILAIITVGVMVLVGFLFPIAVISGSMKYKVVDIHCKIMCEELLGNIFRQYNIKVNSKREPYSELKKGYGEADDMLFARNYSLSGGYRQHYFKYIISEGQKSYRSNHYEYDEYLSSSSDHVFLYSYIKIDKLDRGIRSKCTYITKDSNSSNIILKKLNDFIGSLEIVKFKDMYGNFFTDKEMEQLENICKNMSNTCDITIRNGVMAVFVYRGEEMMFHKGTEEECLRNLVEYISNINKIFDVVLNKLEQ